MLYLIILFIAVVFAIDYNAYLYFYTPKNYLLMLLTPLTLLIFFIINHIKSKQLKFKISILEILLLMQIIWMEITNINFLTHPSSQAFYVTLSLLLITFIVRQLQSKDDHEKQNKYIIYFLRTLWICGLIEALIGFYQFYSFYGVTIQAIKTPMTGTVGLPNGYGLFLAISIIAAFIDIRKGTTFIHRLLIYISILIILSALVLNGSRGALLGLIVAGLGFLSVKYKFFIFAKKKLQLLIVIPVLIICLIGSTWLLYKVNPESSSGRLMVWRISFPMLLDNPVFGVGQEKVAVEYLNYQALFFEDQMNMKWAYKATNLKQIQNEYLQAFCERGIIGGILFLLIWMIPLPGLYRHYREDPQNRKGYLILLLMLGTILIHSMVDTPMHLLPISIVSISIFGLVPYKKYEWSFSASKSLSVMILTILFIYSIFMLYKIIKEYPAYYYWQKGVDATQQIKWEEGVQYYRKALENLPDQGELEFHLGSALVFTGKLDEATTHLDKATDNFNDRNLHLSLAYANLRNHQYEIAEKHTLTALKMFPDHLAPHLLLGEIYYYLGNFNRSKYSLMKCINKDTHIESAEVEQIARDAQRLWKKFYLY